MAVTRANLLTYATERFEELATLSGIAPTDTVAGHKTQIDDTLLQLGHAYADLSTAQVAEGSAQDAFALLTYYELVQISVKLGAKRDPEVSGSGGVKFAKSSQLIQVRELLAEARLRVEALGYDVSGGGWSIGRINLDFLEVAGSA